MPARQNSTPSDKPVAYLRYDAKKTSRADVFLAAELPRLPRSQWQKMFRAGLIRRGGKNIKPSTELNSGDELAILQQPDRANPAYQAIDVVYKDKDVVVINKPAGVLVHTATVIKREPTVQTFIQDYLKEDVERGGIVHRLDRTTSGVMICARTEQARQHLQRQFAERAVAKWYVARIAGELADEEILIDIPIQRHPKKPQQFRPGISGKPAQTQVYVLGRKDGVTELLLRPITGRTHQLRVHAAHLGHPIVGDKLYQGPDADRLALHAFRLSLQLPNGQTKTFQAELPNDVSWNTDADTVTQFIDQTST